MQEKPLQIERVDDAGGASVIFRLHGPLLLGNFFSFQSLVRSDQSKLLMVDMADVPYIDSAGIGCLVGAHVSREHSGRKARHRGRARAPAQHAESDEGGPIVHFSPDGG